MLTQIVLKAQSVGFLNGFKVSPQGLGFPILQYPDDTLILTNGDLHDKVVKNTFIWFEACSGLKVNTSKSVLYQVNIVDEWERIVDV